MVDSGGAVWYDQVRWEGLYGMVRQDGRGCMIWSGQGERLHDMDTLEDLINAPSFKVALL